MANFSFKKGVYYFSIQFLLAVTHGIIIEFMPDFYAYEEIC